MSQGMMNTVVSAIVGGIVGAGVVFFAGGTGNKTDNKTDLANTTSLELAELKVDKLTITEHAAVLNKEGNPEVILKDGSVLVENVILAKKMIARQLQAHAMVANRVFATPDNLMEVPMEQWKFYAELGASTDAGGEIVVRSANGPASVGKPINAGSLFRMGYDPEYRPQMLALNNPNRAPMNINYELTESQKQLMNAAMANPQGVMPQAANFNSPASIPTGGYISPNGEIPSVPTVARPDAGNPIR